MSVALTIDGSWNDAKPKMKLSAKHTPAGEGDHARPPGDAPAERVREGHRDQRAEEDAPEHDRVERRVDALHEQRQAAASMLHGHAGTLVPSAI
jgi:hypothetical protein